MKILTLTLNTLLAIIIFGVVAFLVAPRLGLTSPLELKIVRSGSMEPAIPTGSVVLIQPASDYQAGDIITFGADTPTSIPISHRIVSIETKDGTIYYTTKGDANKTADQNETPANKVIGRVIFSVQAVGYILAFSKTQLGFALLVLIPAALIICYELIGIVQEVRALRRRKREGSAVRSLAEEPPEPSLVPDILPRRREEVVERTMHIPHFDIETPAQWTVRTAP